MIPSEDAVAMLLPGAAEVDVQHARRVTRFLRLLVDDARAAHASSVGVDYAHASSELERQDGHALQRALTDLLRHHLDAASSPDSFLWLGEPESTAQAAWQTLAEFRARAGWLAGVPEPAESPLSVASRLIESLARLDASAAEWWRIRLAHCGEGPRAAERLLRGALDAPERAGSRAELVCALAECLLDRGALRDARELLAVHVLRVPADVRARQLLVWACVCGNEIEAARAAQNGLPVWSGWLPAALVELRAQRTDWAPLLNGKAREARERALHAPLRDRTEIGASVLAVFTFRAGEGARPLWIDAAPALRAEVASWIVAREGAAAVQSEREHALLVGARSCVEHKHGERVLRGTLGREATRALALAPVLDDDGEVAGWLHVECEHHLLPSEARFAEFATAWRAPVLAARAEATHGVRALAEAPTPHAACELVRAAFEDLVQELGIKTAQRRWWGFEVRGESVCLAAEGGDGFPDAASAPGSRRALARARLAGGMVVFDEPNARLAIHGDASSGAVFPLAAERRLCGLLAIESSRRRDFRAPDVARIQARVERAGLALRLAQFRAWHRARFGFDVWFDAYREDFRAFAGRLIAAARSRAPVVLTGPAACGKQVLARWLHFESASRDGPLEVLSCGIEQQRGGWAAALERADGGSLVLDDVERLAPTSQEDLLRTLEDRPEAARVFATTRVGLTAAARGGALRHDLAARLDRLQLAVPGLAARRDDILPLVELQSARFAREESVRVPALADEALALLWRQPWPGNLRELENVVFKLVLWSARAASDAPVSASDVAHVAAHFGFDLVRRLPSRHPERSDLVAALRTTRKSGGRWNKTRAALYLGWDPDTLVARMHAAGIGDDGLDEEPRGWSSSILTAATTDDDGEPPCGEHTSGDGS